MTEGVNKYDLGCVNLNKRFTISKLIFHSPRSFTIAHMYLTEYGSSSGWRATRVYFSADRSLGREDKRLVD